MSQENLMIAATIVILIVSIVLHEIAHGAVAFMFGDRTAQRAGRLTLNPISHMDVFGSILLPAFLVFSGSPFLFGYAKPVPVNFNALRPMRLGMILVAAAGPLINVILAFIAALWVHYTNNPFTQEVLVLALQLNLVLAVFNMLPILPMDGGRVLFGLLPRSLGAIYARLEPYGMLVILLLIISPFILNQLGYHFNPLRALIIPPVKWLQGALLGLSGG